MENAEEEEKAEVEKKEAVETAKEAENLSKVGGQPKEAENVKKRI